MTKLSRPTFFRPTNEEIFLCSNIYIDFDEHFVLDFWDSYNPLYYLNKFHFEPINNEFLMDLEDRRKYFEKAIKLK